MTNPSNHGSSYWRSLEELAGDPETLHLAQQEFAEGANELVTDGVSRRQLFGILGASAALAGFSTGCVRKPAENIMPFAQRPEDIIPGQPIFYASAFELSGGAQGIIVESQDGRPTKIEGNPKHIASHGGTSLFAQASVLELYDPARTRLPMQGEAESTWDAAQAGLADLVAKHPGGKGLALVLPDLHSPTMRAQLDQLRTRLPQVRVYVDDPGARHHSAAAAEKLSGMRGARVRYHLDRAKVVASFDADFLGTDVETLRLSREWSRHRKVVDPSDEMSRLYVIEPHFTGTGVMADHRVAVKGSAVGDVLIALAKQLFAEHSSVLQAVAGADTVVRGLPQVDLDQNMKTFVRVLASDLAGAAGRCAVLVGERQPEWVQMLGLLVNGALKVLDVNVRLWFDTYGIDAQGLAELAQDLGKGEVDAVVCLGPNLVYDAPGALGLPALLAKATLVHAGLYRDETGAAAAWHLPLSHALEAWGDTCSPEGLVTLMQPLILPLHGTFSLLELVGLLATGNMVDGYSMVKAYWMARSGERFSDRNWRRALHDGVISGVPRDPRQPKIASWDALSTALAERVAPAKGYEIDFHLDPKLWDGRYANNAWLQELPHPTTKLVWDNAAYVNPQTAENLGVENGTMVRITVDGRSITLPIWVAPGQADDTISLNLGYGRTGVVAEGAGVDVNPLRAAKGGWFAVGQVEATGDSYELVSTQDHGSMKPPTLMGFNFAERPIVLDVPISRFRKNPDFTEKAYLVERKNLKHLWEPPKLTGVQQWGMSIDLGTCTGCNACVIACQAENNIPVVGKKQVSNGREMHWMRIDRYFRGDTHNPTAVVQPMLCQQCEAAPCETVCPVNATTHSPEGLNDMAYNRCIGTRYCSNNCPYKVRRFNFFNYNRNLDPLEQMQKNPDVTVRFRGVMEKCTYCVQRIQEAKIEAHTAGEDKVADGRIVTACQQVCPTDAIIFGDVRDPDSRVSRAKRQRRDYVVLRDLNTHPRTTYLARIRNPHPELT